MKIPEGWPTEEMIKAGWVALHENYYSLAHRPETIRAVFKVMLEAAPTPPAQDGPVAYRTWDSKFGNYLYDEDAKHHPLYPHRQWEPLYTRPDNSELRKAAEETLNWLYGHFDENDPHLENLRASLEGNHEPR